VHICYTPDPLGGGGGYTAGLGPQQVGMGESNYDPFPLRSAGGTMRGWGIKNDLN
jgi:hypothetical protein